MTPRDCIPLLYSALEQPVGIAFECTNVQSGLALLHKARVLADNPALKSIQIMPSRSKPEKEIWLVNRGTPAEQPRAED